MNTRLQVEHGVTELITGIDIVEQMVKIASGYQLPFKQKGIKLNGWALESRICAEDPSCGFIPSTGKITSYKEPPTSENIRVDTGTYDGGEISMFYDSMIAKLCTYGKDRNEAIELMKKALGEYVIRGISNNISFLQAILSTEKFNKADISTNFIDEEYKEGFTGARLTAEHNSIVLCAAAFISLKQTKRASEISSQLRGSPRLIGTRWVVQLDGTNYPVTVRPFENGYRIGFEAKRFYISSRWEIGNKLFQCKIDGNHYNLQIEQLGQDLALTFMGSVVQVKFFSPRAAELNKFMKERSAGSLAQKDLVANISGMVVEVKVKEKEEITKGQPLIIVDAMKMENVMLSTVDGVVKKIHVEAKQVVSNGDLMIEID